MIKSNFSLIFAFKQPFEIQENFQIDLRMQNLETHLKF